MAGKETFRALQTVNPQVRVLLISGFSKDDRTSELINSGVRGFVQKPFRRHELAQKIQDAIQ